MDIFGNSFLQFVSQNSYDRIWLVLGRNLGHFLHGLDNLLAYLRFSFPELKPPSFFCENETEEGLTLHYMYDTEVVVLNMVVIIDVVV